MTDFKAMLNVEQPKELALTKADLRAKLLTFDDPLVSQVLTKTVLIVDWFAPRPIEREATDGYWVNKGKLSLRERGQLVASYTAGDMVTEITNEITDTIQPTVLAGYALAKINDLPALPDADEYVRKLTVLNHARRWLEDVAYMSMYQRLGYDTTLRTDGDCVFAPANPATAIIYTGRFKAKES